MSTVTLNPLDADILMAIAEDAEDGKPTRSNAAYGKTVRRHKDSVKRAIDRLESMGEIVIQRDDTNWRRRIHVKALDAWTGWTKQGADEKPVTAKPCMSCGKDFPSEGIHNRICGACKTRGYAPDYFGVTPRDRTAPHPHHPINQHTDEVRT